MTVTCMAYLPTLCEINYEYEPAKLWDERFWLTTLLEKYGSSSKEVRDFLSQVELHGGGLTQRSVQVSQYN